MASLIDFLDRHAHPDGSLTVALLGLGRTNSSLIPLIEKRRNTRVTVYEYSELLTDSGADIVFVSPSVRRERADLMALAKGGAVITSDTEVYFDGGAKDSYAVTGSDGKSTVTYIASRLLSTENREVFPAGNFGTPFSTLPSGHRTVAELSSFSLTCLTPKTHRAIITNISENHLNWHKSLTEYIEAKAGVLAGADFSVLSLDDEYSRSLIPRVKRLILISSGGEDSSLYPFCEAVLTLREDIIYLNGKRFFDTRCMRRSLSYDKINMMGALALTLGEVTKEKATKVAEEFGGLPHRAECVGIYRGVEYINSSIDTTPSRTASTLIALSRPVHIILGGRGKGLSTLPLLSPISRYAKSISLYGEAGEEFLSDLIPLGIKLSLSQSFDDAFYSAVMNAKRQDTVLLSPAATAYGEFEDFTKRGERFTALARTQ